MSGFVYVWINNINDKYYIGSHRGTTDDGYVGSGIWFKKAVKKYGIENFTRHIIYEGGDYRDEEREALTIVNAADDSRSYNMINTIGGDGSCRVNFRHSEESKKKMSEKHRDRIPRRGYKISEQGRANVKKAAQNRKKRRPCSDENRANLSAALKGKPKSLAHRQKMSAMRKGVVQPHKFRPMSEESKKKMSDTKRRNFALKQMEKNNE